MAAFPAVDGYRLTRLLGRGGNGAVYAAIEEKEHGRYVAIKVFSVPGAPSEELRGMFRREIESARSLHNHSNVVTVYDWGYTTSGTPYVVMEPLAPLPSVMSWQMFDKTARHLTTAVLWVHRHDEVHSDIKPSNVLVSESGTVKLADFGVSRLLLRSATLRRDTGFSHETAAPEILDGATYKTDEFALARTLQLLWERVYPQRPMPPVLDEALRACTARAPGDRPGIDRLLAAIEAGVQSAPAPAEVQATEVAGRWGLRHSAGAAAAALVILGATASAWLLPGSGPKGNDPASAQPGDATSIPAKPTSPSAPTRTGALATTTLGIPSTTRTPTPPTAAPAATQPTIAPTTSVVSAFPAEKSFVGVIGDLTGIRPRDVFAAVELAESAIPGPQSLAHPAVELCDDAGDAQVAARCALAWMAQEGLLAIIGPTSSDSASAVLDALAGTGIPVLAIGSTRSQLSRAADLDASSPAHPNLFRLTSDEYGFGRFAATISVNRERTLIVTDSSEGGQAVAAGAVDLLTSRGLPFERRPVDAQAASPLAFGRVVYAARDPALADVLLHELTGQGWTGVFVAGDQLFVEGFAGSRCSTQIRCFGLDTGARLKPGTPFAAAFTAATARPPTEWAAYGYDAYHLIADRAATLPQMTPRTPADLRGALVGSIRRHAWPGATGEVSFDVYGETRSTALTVYRHDGRGWQHHEGPL